MSTEAPAKLEHYRVVAEESTITAHAFAEGLFSAFGHDPVLAIKDFTGEAQFVAGTFENASVKVIINASAIQVINDVKDKDREEIARTMRADVLEIDKYPEVSFSSHNIALSRSGEGRYRARIIGDLTLHGVTQKNVWISAEVSVSEENLRVTGEVPIKQTDYKIKLVSVAGGTLKVKNEVKCSFDVVARAAKA